MENQQESLQFKLMMEGVDINSVILHKTLFRCIKDKMIFIESMASLTIDQQCDKFKLGRHIIKSIRKNISNAYKKLQLPKGFKEIPINSAKTYLINEEGVIIEKDTRFIIKTSIDYKGYKRANVTFTKENGTNAKYERVHRLVGLTFIPNTGNLPFINHIDGDKLNNKVKNLEWCTAKENSEHAVKAGLKNSDKIRGSKNYQAKLDECKVKEILQSFMTPTEVANTYGISISVASKIIKRQTWKHVEL